MIEVADVIIIEMWRRLLDEGDAPGFAPGERDDVNIAAGATIDPTSLLGDLPTPTPFRLAPIMEACGLRETTPPPGTKTILYTLDGEGGTIVERVRERFAFTIPLGKPDRNGDVLVADGIELRALGPAHSESEGLTHEGLIALAKDIWREYGRGEVVETTYSWVPIDWPEPEPAAYQVDVARRLFNRTLLADAIERCKESIVASIRERMEQALRDASTANQVAEYMAGRREWFEVEPSFVTVPADQGAILAGIDVARSGRDATALTLYGRAGDTLKVLDQAGDEVHEWQRGLGRALRHETLSIDLDEPPIMGVHAGQIAIDEMDRQLRRQAQRDELGADLMALGIALAEDQRVLGDLTRESWADGPQPADLEDRIAAMCAGLAADYAPKFARAEARLLAWQEGHDDAFPDDDDDDLDDGDDDDDGDDVDEDDEGWQCATVFEATTTLVLTLADVTLGYREFRVIAPLTPFERELMRRDPWDASPINCRCAVLPADIEDDGVHVTDELVEVYQQQLLAATDEDARAFLREQQARKPQYTLGRVEIWGAPV